MSRRRWWITAVLAALGVVGSFVLVRWAAIELFAAIRRSQFEARPELENWANPYLGFELQGSITAFITLVAVALSIVLAHQLRRRALLRTVR